MREYFDDNFSYFSLKQYVVTSHLDCLLEMVQMRGHDICFYAALTKIIPFYHQILPLIYGSAEPVQYGFQHDFCYYGL